MFRCCGVSILGVMRRIVVKGNTTLVLWCTVHMNGLGRHTIIVIETSYEPKKFALNYLTWNFTEVVMTTNKVNPEILVAVS